ncbi:hypothetical protein DOT_5420 [Desulfosporosinus sp. OT]|nr:hypothetical protein DOT_5420 [Desulfosporosinus sp. OT]
MVVVKERKETLLAKVFNLSLIMESFRMSMFKKLLTAEECFNILKGESNPFEEVKSCQAMNVYTIR